MSSFENLCSFIITHADVSRGSKAFSGVSVCVYFMTVFRCVLPASNKARDDDDDDDVCVCVCVRTIKPKQLKLQLSNLPQG